MYEELSDLFAASVDALFESIAGVKAEPAEDIVYNNPPGVAMGITSIISFKGLINGKFMLDAKPQLVMKMMDNLMADPNLPADEKPVIGGMAELSNIIAGDAITAINNKYKLKLRLSTPNVFVGKQMLGKNFLFTAARTYKTDFGKFKFFLGFETEYKP